MNRFWEPLIEGLPGWLPELLWACLQTIQLTTLSFLVAVPLGMIIVAMRLSKLQFLRWFAISLIEVARGTPALVILFIIYFGLPSIAPWLSINSLAAAVVGLGLQGGAILAEIFRAGIEAIDRGQRVWQSHRDRLGFVIFGLNGSPDRGRCSVGQLIDNHWFSVFAFAEFWVDMRDARTFGCRTDSSSRKIVIFMLHIWRICSAKVPNAHSTHPPCCSTARPAEARRGHP
jgi:His/Glu/Gln/Arg/opine family amino acid ABC transporter permease subunit